MWRLRRHCQDSIAAALAEYDFATMFRRVRAVAGWSQQTLGNLVGMERRDFVELAAALTLGVAGVDVDRLTALLPAAEPTGARHVGASDVEVIEQSTAAFVRQDFVTGAGPIRDLAVAQLRATLPLLGAEMTPEVRPRLYLATACLATQAGWMSFQVNQHDAARRLWLIALDIARDADHPLGADHTVFVL